MGEPISVPILEHNGKMGDRFVYIGERDHFLVDNHGDHITVCGPRVFPYTP